jgi:hypothetical protein
MTKSVEFSICTCGNPDGHKGPVWHPGQPLPIIEGHQITEAEMKVALQGATASTMAKSAAISGVVTRCGCSDRSPEGLALSHGLDKVNGTLLPCPKPRSSSDLGTISYWNANPLKRLFWALVSKRQADKRIQKANSTL